MLLLSCVIISYSDQISLSFWLQGETFKRTHHLNMYLFGRVGAGFCQVFLNIYLPLLIKSCLLLSSYTE
jgi:hypothetical protein